MRIWIVLTAVSFFMVSCSAYVEQDAFFVGYNTTRDNVVVHVNDGNGWEIPANGSTKFTAQILVPKNPVIRGGYGNYGPSTVDKVVRVSVAFRNLRTGQLTTPIFCDSGAKLITHVSYEVLPGGIQIGKCLSDY